MSSFGVFGNRTSCAGYSTPRSAQHESKLRVHTSAVQFNTATMSTGAQQPKRARTIDAFFAPKQQAKNVVGVELPRRGAAPRCATLDTAGGGATNEEARNPSLEAQQPPSDAALVAAAVQAAGPPVAAAEGPPRRSPRIAGRKRTAPEPVAAATTTDAETTEANTIPPGRCLQGGVAGATSGDGAEGRVQEEAACTSASEPLGAGGTGGQTELQQQEGGGGGGATAAAATAGGGDAAPAAEDDGLTPAQRAQVAANRNRALARRVVAEAAAGGSQPSLSSLLVEPSWREALVSELRGSNLRQLESFLHTEWCSGRKPIFPPKECIFQAMNACPFDQVRVVILGQDPYHGPGQAMGLSFSVPRDVRPLPPSLLNIYKEAATDLGWEQRPEHGDLSSWSVQGVLLLNTCLTVRQGEANSHAKRGWEAFTDAAIRALSEGRSGLVFLLWGNPAQAKASLVDTRKHHVLKAAHPSPLSASRGFFGCRHFSRTNQLLGEQGLATIQWRPT
ncbi:hypothetical protein PLESTM_001946900 [Pleodorina starrii]|nr:hypothetical protein PLESTM_001946900 [Pleodorina starrii]